MQEKSHLRVLLETLPQRGKVEWIGVRPGRDEPIQELKSVDVGVDSGLEGDRFSGKAGSKRQVTLIQSEHLPVIASLLNQTSIEPSVLRRNIVVSGINLLALKDKQFQIGEVDLLFTGLCQPCSKMELALGPGGYNAMRGHGGITATVVKGGAILLGDTVSYRSSSAKITVK